MPVNLYYTQKVRGFQQESTKYWFIDDLWQKFAENLLKSKDGIEKDRNCTCIKSFKWTGWPQWTQWTFCVIRKIKSSIWSIWSIWSIKCWFVSRQIKQAYGFKESEYFKLKIYHLPEISSGKSIWVSVTNRRWGNKSLHWKQRQQRDQRACLKFFPWDFFFPLNHAA